MNTMYRSNNMYNVKVSTNMSKVKVVILVWNIFELM
jgi:hypothetical protein